VFASTGVMTVDTKQGVWVMSLQRAVWIPAKTPHRISMSGLPRLNDIHLGFVAKARQISFAVFPRRSELADIVAVFLHHRALGPVDQRRSRRAELKMPRSRDATVSRVIMIPRR